MIAYVDVVTELLKRFVKVEIAQIPIKENAEADRLIRMASATERTWIGDPVLLNADARSGVIEICSIKEMKDWRMPIIQMLRSSHFTENLKGSAEKTLRIKFFIMGGFLYRRSFTHPYLNACISKKENIYYAKFMREKQVPTRIQESS